MPNYDFKCNQCGEKFSKMVSMNERGKVLCPKCSGSTQQLFTGCGVLKSGSAKCGSAGKFT